MIVWVLFFMSIARGDEFEALRKISSDSISRNIVKLEKGYFLAAGANQFRSLWTRDFCFGSRGLYEIGRADVVRDHLKLLLGMVRNGLVPRYVGSATHFQRVLGYVFHFPIPLKDPVWGEYDAGGAAGEGVAFDANLLVLITALQYVEKTSDSKFWAENVQALEAAFRFYDDHISSDSGLVTQPEFSDWQDSVSRKGQSFYLNLLYWKALQALAQKKAFGVELAKVQRFSTVLREKFFRKDIGLYRTLVDREMVTLDGNLLAIDLGLDAPDSEAGQTVWKSLRNSPLWKNKLPGFNSWENYPEIETHKLVLITNMHDYHSGVYWSWLMALSARVATEMNDMAEALRILKALERLAVRDGSIIEVYEPSPEMRPVSRIVNLPILKYLKYRVFRAERPFSWGAGMTLDALAKISHKKALY